MAWCEKCEDNSSVTRRIYDGECSICCSLDRHRDWCRGSVPGALDVCTKCNEPVFAQITTRDEFVAASTNERRRSLARVSVAAGRAFERDLILELGLEELANAVKGLHPPTRATLASAPDVTVTCPCSTTFRVSATKAGLKGKCGVCRGPITVPFPAPEMRPLSDPLEERECPECCERVKKRAKKCKHCAAQLVPGPSQTIKCGCGRTVEGEWTKAPPYLPLRCKDCGAAWCLSEDGTQAVNLVSVADPDRWARLLGYDSPTEFEAALQKQRQAMRDTRKVEFEVAREELKNDLLKMGVDDLMQAVLAANNAGFDPRTLFGSAVDSIRGIEGIIGHKPGAAKRGWFS